ncbi:putative hydroxyindole O-methyltransferase [Eremomyces bilateralis CBS 781.70]|uniref:Hydroxyindole O-methyltransferase n=1 Tax=Eremomyces bilateralis CBS 781.70 TaxID=1392243 RepID=A0A6G1G9Q8_9PEZI|nr:putative hydroxyindole O-methyltransferase [Eremomyces bilateralis CBS 781.70]KAF1814599.1 putative hydroxyindole O-methyltransferase [Eremomyces bilateralis CBS 781.70]
MASPPVAAILESLATAGKAFDKNEAGSREALIENSRALVAALEIPSEFIQRSFWAEPAMSANIAIAVDVKLFQHLKEAGDAGLSGAALAEKTGFDVDLLERLARHLVAMNILTYHDGAFHATALSKSLAEENYQHSISFCYDAARASFNGFPEFFKKTAYKSPASGGLDGPFQDAHKTKLPFFEWLVATPPYLQYFGSFMSAYRAGKANWYDAGFYPVAERIITGFDAEASDVLLVDVGGGGGHDVAAFAAQYASRPGKIVLQDRESVIAGVLASTEERSYEAQPHDFFTPQPIHAARAYSLHSILHDWSDEKGVKILENLVPALKKGYSRVLLNEIVVSEEKPTLAATSMDMMMLAHFAVRERTEANWRAILAKAGLKVVNIYTYPGVAESLIEAELA